MICSGATTVRGLIAFGVVIGSGGAGWLAWLAWLASLSGCVDWNVCYCMPDHAVVCTLLHVLYMLHAHIAHLPWHACAFDCRIPGANLDANASFYLHAIHVCA